MLITVAVIGPQHRRNARARSESKLSDVEEYSNGQGTTFYANHRPNCAWFVEAVLPTGDKLADHRTSCAWFVEAVLPTGDSNVTTENLKSVAATL